MGGSTPKPDPNIGIAAKKSAETGEMMLNWMKDQAQITNGWATEDRARAKTVFEPMQDAFIAEANGFATPERKQAAADAAAADVGLQAAQAGEIQKRQAMAMGVNPMSGRFINASAKAGTDAALASAGAGNLARRTVDDQGRQMRAAAVNMGSGMMVNPLNSMQTSSGSVQSGGSAAMSGYGQQGNLLNMDFQNRMQAYQQQQTGIGGLFGALGSVAGAFIPSSKEIKHGKQPVDALGAIREMPVEQWTYNEGQGDGGTHVGPYAEDFQKATGVGDGKSIDAITMMGLTMGAVRELDAKVSQIQAMMGGEYEDEATEDKASDAAEDAAEGEMDDPKMPMAMGAIPPKRKMKPQGAARMVA